MTISRRLIFMIAGNYPEQTLIESAKYEGGRYGSFLYLMKDGKPHTLLCSFTPNAEFKGFMSEEEGNNHMDRFAQDMCEIYKELYQEEDEELENKDSE
jgi:hypothetical protein